MKFETTAGLLTAALNRFTRVIERRNTIPILSCVLFDGRTIRGTDLDLELSLPVPATIGEGKIAIDHRSLLNLVRHIPADDTVRIEGGSEGVTITFSSGRYDLPSLPADDFPDLPVGELVSAPVAGDAFKRAIAFVSPFISTEETRYYLNGVCLDKDVAVATDGHRLGCHPLGSDLSAFPQPIVPRKAIALLGRLPAPKSLGIATKQHPRMSVETGGVRLVTKLIDGTYPDWRRVVPRIEEATSSTLEIDPATLLAASRRIMAAACSGRPCGTLAWADGRVVLVAASPDSGKAREYLAHATASGEGGVSFNFAYLAAIARLLGNADAITAVVDSSGGPVTFRAGSDEAFTLLMPMRRDHQQFAAETLKMFGARQSLGRAA